MAKLCLKKNSKRIACRTRYKVESKVREHNRKKRRTAKKDPFAKGRSAHNKPIHVPNICPFKEDILEEVAQVKQRKEEERLAQRKKWADERAAAKLTGLENLVEDAEAKQSVHETLGIPEEVIKQRSFSSEGSRKAYYREFKKVIAASDVVLEIVDARDPLGTRCLQVEQAVLDAPGNKRLIIVMNKSDLVSRENLDAWLKYLRRSFPTTAMKASTQVQRAKLCHRKFTPNAAVKTSNCVGASLVMSLLANYCRNKGIKTAITVGVVGMPNVGKSSIINSLKRSRACNVGALPGMTKVMQVVQLDSKIQLLDSPGVVMSKISDEASALKNVMNVATIKAPVVAATAILNRANKEQLTEMYDIGDYNSPEEFLALLAKRCGRQKKGGIPDINTVARLLVNDWNRGKIKYHTIPPEEQLDSHVSAEIVKQMADEFNIDDLGDLEKNVFNALELKQVDLESSSLLPTPSIMDIDAQAEDMLPDNVSVTTGENKKKLRWRKEAKANKQEKPDKELKLEGNQKLNKAKKVQLKKLKKEKARTVRKTDNLADVLENFSLKANNSVVGPGDAYDFTTDFSNS